MKKLVEELDRRQANLALPTQNATGTDVQVLLDMDRARIRGMTAEDCGEAALLLRSEAYYLQRYHNRVGAVAKWCEARLREIIAHDVGQVKGWSYQERAALAIRQNDAARRCNDVMVQAQTYAEDVNYLAARVEQAGQEYSNLARIKQKQHG